MVAAAPAMPMPSGSSQPQSRQASRQPASIRREEKVRCAIKPAPFESWRAYRSGCARHLSEHKDNVLLLVARVEEIGCLETRPIGGGPCTKAVTLPHRQVTVLIR